MNPPISGRIVELERSTSVRATSKTENEIKLQGKVLPYRHRQQSEPVRRSSNCSHQDILFPDGSNENFHSNITPTNVNTSRFRLFPRIGSKASSLSGKSEDLLEAKDGHTDLTTTSIVKEANETELPTKKSDLSQPCAAPLDNEEKETLSSQSPGKTSNRVIQTLRKYLDFTLFCKPTFVSMTLSVMCMSLGVPHVLFFLPNFVRSLDVGADPATLLAIISIFDLIGRLSTGLILDAELVPKYLMFTIFIALSATSVIFLPLANSFTSLVMVMVFYGSGTGSWFLMVPLLLADYFGVENIGSSYGLLRLCQSFSNLGGPLVAGIIKDSTGSFAYSFYVMGAIMLLGTVFSLLLASSSPYTNKKELENESIEEY